MATILFSAVGAAVGSAVGGSVLGLSMTAVGRFIGASFGRALDQRLMGQGAETIETGRVERFRLSGAGEGAAIAQVYGRMRIGGHVIWATEFTEHVKKKKASGGGKGAPSQPTVKSYSYSVSLALALCEGEISGVTRVWADGAELPVGDLNMRVYPGSLDQQPDPKMEAVEGTGMVPAYRGTAYVVIEDLMLESFGNRVPQFSFEVTRPVQDDPEDVPHAIRGVAMIPGTGEYALATEPVHMSYGGGSSAVVNVNSPTEAPDFNSSLDQLTTEMPGCGAVSLVVSWFGSDLRCAHCEIRPKIEQAEFDGKKMKWKVSGLARGDALLVPRIDDRPVYGGTPCDESVVQAIRRMTDQGLSVMYYPFILMDQLAGNGIEDPWSGATDQPTLPWRGRITLDVAPGRDGSADGSAAAAVEVAAFFGAVTAADFSVGNGTVGYSGPAEWSYSRFILHQAALCAAAGGVEAFCIGSEMRALTQIRSDAGFPAVAMLRALAAECRALLGPGVKLGYAADWSEYFGYHPDDGSGDVYFHLDPLWADDEIDFIGIDNYMPLSDWRDGDDHADAHWGAIYNLDYLMVNVAGGEGYDWYYPSAETRAAQRREPITDGAHGEPWVWRYKDIRGWWENAHHERIGGLRQTQPTAWVPASKPIRFTELGCAALDKGTNQPNKFLDAKSSESRLPHYSNGLRDELIQRHYLRAMHGYWGDPANNPVSEEYGGPMLDMDHAYVWAWDARPYPWFPGLSGLWSDGDNYRRGHWLNGRVSSRTLASVVAEICDRVGLHDYDVSGLYGWVRGYVVDQVGDARRSLQPLMLAHGFDAIERDGALSFVTRRGRGAVALAPETLAVSEDLEGDLVRTRASEAEMAGRVRLRFVEADGDHAIAAEETVLPDEETHAVAETELSMALTRREARMTVERWLAEGRIARETLRFALPPSRLAVSAGDVISLPAEAGRVLARVDRVEVGTHQLVEAVRIEPDVYLPSDFLDQLPNLRPFTPAVPVLPLFMDLPLMSGEEVAHAPHVALTADPWPGSVAIYDSAFDGDYVLNEIVAARAVVGVTETEMHRAPEGRLDHGPLVQLRLFSGALQSISDEALLAGGNLMAIGDGTPGNWEIFQFRDAQMAGENVWLLGHRLRGQFGTDGGMPDAWPAGSWVVALDGTPQQIALAAALRRQQRHYRIGPARRPYDDPAYVHEVHAFDGNGLRPYRPVHLRASESGGIVSLSWVRRTRIDGDDWTLEEVPLGEESEAYQLRVMQGETLLRSAQVAQPSWSYDPALDGISGVYAIEVAQISARYGAGPFARVSLSA
ncbi:glycoside hydrolase/phage tail family protein [Salipiger sp. P9]|uniref:baseplate multidomain protein megatron n=1 Tax=Salipiger pentaromativorans TaxID=2943193 RepID=UPI002157270C|nr:glycoside hydrolase/phage tail family protein [Salipiger pentaromativorans]MCR8546576.1 glycoside hydrolase/phage tail family protein [Salipiger pentaromativorans]